MLFLAVIIALLFSVFYLSLKPMETTVADFQKVFQHGDSQPQGIKVYSLAMNNVSSISLRPSLVSWQPLCPIFHTS